MKKFYFLFVGLCLMLSQNFLKAQTGSTCTNAHVITSLPFDSTGLTTGGTGDNYSSGPCSGSGNYMSGNDYVFSYTPVANETIGIVLTNTGNGVGIFVTDSCPDVPGASCIAQATSIAGNPSVSNLNLVAGTQYYILVSTYNLIGMNPSTDFDISIHVCSSSPTAAFTYTQDSLNVTFVNTSANGSHYVWYFGDELIILPPPYGGDTAANPTHTYSGYGTYDVTLIAYNSCGSTDTLVFPITLVCPGVLPQAGFSWVDNGLTVNFTNNSSDAAGSLWFYGDEAAFPPPQGDTTVNPSHTYTLYGTYEVILIVSNYCGSDTLIDTLTLQCPNPDPPVASFTYVVDSMNIIFTNTSYNGATYQWLFGDEPVHNWFLASNDTNPVHPYSSIGDYTVEMIATSICGFTDTVLVVVTLNCPGNLPQASFTYTQDSLSVSFTNTSSYATSYDWFFGDGLPVNPFMSDNTDANPTNVYAQYGMYDVTMIATNLCGTDTAVFTITLECNAGLPQADFYYFPDSLTVTFTNTSVNGSSYLWYFGDELIILPPPLGGDAAINPVHTYQATGAYNVTLIAYNVCGVPDTLVVTIDLNCSVPAPAASFTYTVNVRTVTFTNTSLFAVSYKWLFGDEQIPNWSQADTSQNPVHTYSQSGTYLARMVAINQCGTDTFVTQIVLTSVEMEENGFHVIFYPNPASDVLNICFNGIPLADQIFIYNILGSEMYSENLTNISGSFSKHISVKEFAKGIYYLKMTINNNTYINKIIVE
ncbi:MAG: PKD domain-containing protein [Bacteroidia bacterium]|nr:PKD domain-containing protein [Bacteroidia bacterium]